MKKCHKSWTRPSSGVEVPGLFVTSTSLADAVLRCYATVGETRCHLVTPPTVSRFVFSSGLQTLVGLTVEAKLWNKKIIFIFR